MTSNYKSEYFGIRVAMHDALQRYYAADKSMLTNSDKIELLRRTIQAACRDNSLFTAERKEIVGRSWVQFISSRPSEAILEFLDTPEVIEFSKPVGKPLKEKVRNLSSLDIIAILFKSRNFSFEKIAQETGLINYQAGDSLSANLRDAEKELRTKGPNPVTGPEATPENPANRKLIHSLFDTEFGTVPDEHTGVKTSRRINPAGSGVKSKGR